ncbi:MAG: AAA family ATPase [Leptospiraceae bacterium]|nr:AAA family ATPase [Leptospiraceae bacterium]
MKINKYESTEKIYEGNETSIYRASNTDTSEKVILKFAKTETAFLRIKNEFETLDDLKIDGISNVIEFFPYSEQPCLVVSNFNGIPLTNFLKNFKSYPLEKICTILINITTVIGRIHQKNIIHKDIKPSNILFNEKNDSISIIDFGISSLFDFKLREQKNINNLEGTLKYISPEQTGRVNRYVDQRSDLYSLGITFYQLLMGELPFQTDDPAEIIFYHITRTPESIRNINQTLSDIILKMISKNPEDRYQSTHGLLFDLNKIKQGENKFLIATKDFSERLQFNENLYGRDKEKIILKTLLEKTNKSAEQANYLVIKGNAGEGKSILIEEILKNTILKNGYFLRGKHDQIQQNIPYSSLSQIFKTYTDLLLSEKNEVQLKIKTELLNAIGDNAGVITAFAPSLELILGYQPSPFLLEGSEALNRFNTIMVHFMKAIARTTIPIVIVLDDLQWADKATIDLLKKIVDEIYIPGLFLILSYRDKEEYNTYHFLSFMKYLDSISYVENIELANLTLEDIRSLLIDTVGENTIDFNALVEFIFITTKGNPFFAKELLKELYSTKALYFDFSLEKWYFAKQVIQNLSLGNDILHFMKNKINSLSSNTILLLKIASCEGIKFNKNSIRFISNFNEDQLKSSIREASIAGIIYSLENNIVTDNYYSFLHDKVLQTAYQLNSDLEIKKYNFQFGNYYTINDPDTKIFDICNFYNNSFDLFTNETDILRLIEFNYKAMLLAKKNIAYENGLNFAKITISYLGKIKTVSKDLVFSIYEEYGWFLFATGNFDEGEKVYIDLLKDCNNLKDYARINNIRIGSLASRARIFDSVNLGLEVLEKLGVSIPESEEERGGLFFSEYGRILKYLESNKVTDLLTLNPMNDEIQMIIQQILSRLLIPTILSAQLTLLGVLTCISITRVIDHGSIDLVAYAYALFAVTIISIKQDYKTGIEFGEIAITASQLNSNKALMGGVFNTVGCITNHLKYPAIENEILFLKSSKYCDESGNIFENVLSQGNSLWNKFYRGENLNEILVHCNNYKSICKKYHVWEAMINIYYPTMGLVNYLTGAENNGDILYYDDRTEIEHVEIVEKLGSKSPLAQFYGILITKSFIFGKYEEILKTGELLEKNTAAPTVFHDICPNFYRCVAYILLFDSLDEEEKKFYDSKILKLKSEFKTFSELNPSNFQHMYSLIQAVEHLKLENPWEGIKYLEESIQSALKNRYIQNAAIAYEIGGNFYKKNNLSKLSDTYYWEAYKLFKMWGAELKIKVMEKEFPEFHKEQNLLMSNYLTLTSSKSATDFQIDYISTMKTFDIILREVRTDHLIRKIIQIILENSGANEATLIIKKNNIFIAHTHGKVIDNIIIEYINQPLDKYENISHNIVNYVINSKKNIVLSKAYMHLEYLNNNYITNKKVQSLLCQPILHKGEVIGALYLENNFIGGVFSKDRTEIINLISTLAGISIENASLYEELDEKVKLRTSELNSANSKLMEMNSLLEQSLHDLKTTQDQLLISEKLVVLGKLIAGIAHEINTPLGAIVASNQVIMDLLSEDYLNLLETFAKFDENEKEAWTILYQNAKQNQNFLDTNLTRKVKKELSEFFVKENLILKKYIIDGLSDLGISTKNITLLLPYLSLKNFESIVGNCLDTITLLNSGKIIKNAADKASKVIKALKNYVHQDQMEKRIKVDIRAQIEMCLVLYQNKIKPEMEIITEFLEDTFIVGYPDQLNQIWINLINNALYAVKYEGKLTIRCSIQNEFLLVSFTDNGQGIPPEIQNNIFKPFFTTKSAEDGSGLGLDICQKITEIHSGKIKFTSVPGETCFTVFLNRFLKPTE